MTNILPFLKSLLSIPGLSGYEDPAARLIQAEWQPLVDELSLSRLSSLHGFKKGAGEDPRPSIMLAAHMDAIGLMVTQVEDGFLRITSIGGVDPRILPGQAVIVHATGADAKEDLPGVIVMPPVKLLPPGDGTGVVDLPHLLVDVGLLPSKVARLVRVGDLVSFGTEAVEMSGEIVSGHSLDNRVSVAALTLCLGELQSKPHAWDVWAVATVQEEITYAGAATSAFQLRPNLAIAIDTTFAKGPGANDWQTFELGKGPTFGHGPNIHPYLFKQFKELAEQLEIPYATEIMPTSSGTDGMAMQVTAEGIPTFVLSIPIRYMHTPVEMVAVKDIQRAGRLLAEFVSGLEPDFMSAITWDD
ncbi:MAG: M20/M25/M40 family metallo-hydrolase [Anaerolineales bacterium]|nr:M20/M25/M40 family metallo-hydrolase [Anaerolineales bacterium]